MNEPAQVDGAPGPSRAEQEPSDTMAIIAAISHELRSPLTSLPGFTRLLLDRWDRLADDDKRELIGQIDHDATRVGRLVTELLDISRIESGRLKLRLVSVPLVELVESVIRRVALTHPNLRCPVEAGPDIERVLADPDKVEQIVTNLVENGAKYATPDRMRCRIERDDEARTVRVCVDDEGPGIPEDELELVFTKFYRRAVAQPSGTGLGLWISRALADAHDGSLTAQANARGGTTFCLTLPTDRRWPELDALGLG
jgi:K+-sensing histidine kinase KdpD